MEISRLTPRRQQVISGLIAGKSNKIIAHELGLEQSTIKIHVRNLLGIYGVTNRTGLVALVMQKRLNIAVAALQSLDCDRSRQAMADIDRV